MNRVMVSASSENNAEVPLPAWSARFKSYAKKVLARLGRNNWDISVLLCDDGTISALNSRYRGKDQATDVLSFSLNEGEVFPPHEVPHERSLPGDIVISLDTMRENARRFNIGEDEELRRLLIHGILHLDGMDHRTNGKTEPMLQLQERILTELAEECILGRNV